MNLSAEEQFHELSFYTLSHKSPAFIHQHIVDAYGAQMANENTKPIAIIFSLVGLYLYIEKGYTGRQVQQMHMKMAKNKQVWPGIFLPQQKGRITITDVLSAAPGSQRDEMIREWCAAVWDTYEKSRDIIIGLVNKY